ncbi:hypothetical protein HK101_004789 [Irineochytrium annulatum]|nr:hypothetical protein HK101_004789 [Irineochytrium annulatum]
MEGQIATAMTSLSTDIRFTVVDDRNVGPHLASVNLYNRFAARLNMPRVNAGTLSPAINEFDATVYFLNDVKTITQDANVLPNTGISDFSDPGNIYAGATSQEEAMDTILSILGDSPLPNPDSWRKLISVKAAILSMSPENNDLRDVADYESHLNTFNIIHDDQPIMHPAEFAPSDHVKSILFVDALNQAKLITGDPLGIVDNPGVDGDGNILAGDLYQGAESADQAFTLTMQSLSSHEITTQEGKIRLARIRNNVRKIVAAVRNKLADAMGTKQTINIDDVNEHGIVTDQLAMVDSVAAKVDLTSVQGLRVLNPATSDMSDPVANDPSFTNSLPNFETNDVKVVDAPALATYENIDRVPAGKAPSARKSYKALNRLRNWFGGKTRASLGTGMNAK